MRAEQRSLLLSATQDQVNKQRNTSVIAASKISIVFRHCVLLSSSNYLLPGGETDSSDDDIIIEELEKRRVTASEVTSKEVVREERQNGNKAQKDGADVEIQESRDESRGGERSGSGRQRTGSRGPSANADVQYQRDMAKAQAISRKETPGCLSAEEVIRLGIRTAAAHGILCRRPNLPLDGNSFAPMDGNCIFTCFCHSNDPSLSGPNLEQATWELRIRAVGTALERLKHFTDEQWAVLQAIVTGNDEDTLTKEEIKQEMEKYMESGEYSGNVGDLLPQLAADFMEQPLLVIEVKDGKVTNLSFVVPGGIFGGQDRGCLVIVVRQLNHYEPLLIAMEARETAMRKYQQWQDSRRVGVTTGAELDDSFNPPCASTPRESHEEARSGRKEGTQSVADAGDSLQGAVHSPSIGQVMNILQPYIQYD